LISTATFRPEAAESENLANPVPVSGKIAEFQSPSPLIESISPYQLERTTDGRYRFVPEVIIGPDNRIQITNTTAWPYPVHGHIIMTFPNGSTYIGSGTMINRHHVLTAGHCVHSKSDGGWATNVQFNAAQNDASLPFGSAFATRLLSVNGWSDDANSDYDFGMLILGSELGNQTGFFGIISFGSDSELTSSKVNVTGYPGDKGGRQMWTHADAIKRVQSEQFFYDIDTVGGQSGSGVWSTWAGHSGEKIAGVHTTGSSSGNGATKLSRWKFDKIVEWFQKY
jgi:glutamyl endopeptidase